MIYTRKLSLSLFILWAILVMGVVGATLERTQRSLAEIRGNRIWQRLKQLPRQLLAQPAPDEAEFEPEKTGDSASMGRNSSGNP